MMARSRSSSLLSERTVACSSCRSPCQCSSRVPQQSAAAAATGRRWCRPGPGRSRRAASRPASGGRRSRGRSGRRAVRAASWTSVPLSRSICCLAAGDDLAGVGMALDLGVEIVDQADEMRLEQFGRRCHTLAPTPRSSPPRPAIPDNGDTLRRYSRLLSVHGVQKRCGEAAQTLLAKPLISARSRLQYANTLPLGGAKRSSLSRHLFRRCSVQRQYGTRPNPGGEATGWSDADTVRKRSTIVRNRIPALTICLARKGFATPNKNHCSAFPRPGVCTVQLGTPIAE